MTHRDSIQFICLQAQEKRGRQTTSPVEVGVHTRRLSLAHAGENTNSCPFAYPSHYVTLYLLPSPSQGRNSFFRLFSPVPRSFVLGCLLSSSFARLHCIGHAGNSSESQDLFLQRRPEKREKNLADADKGEERARLKLDQCEICILSPVASSSASRAVVLLFSGH